MIDGLRRRRIQVRLSFRFRFSCRHARRSRGVPFLFSLTDMHI